MKLAKAIKLWLRKFLLKRAINSFSASNFYYAHNQPADKWLVENKFIPKTKLWDGIKVSNVEIFNIKYQGRKSGVPTYFKNVVISFKHKDGWLLQSLYEFDWGWITHLGVYDSNHKKILKYTNSTKSDHTQY